MIHFSKIESVKHIYIYIFLYMSGIITINQLQKIEKLKIKRRSRYIIYIYIIPSEILVKVFDYHIRMNFILNEEKVSYYL